MHPTPDITRDRLVLITGGIVVPLMGEMVEPSDAMPVWITLVPMNELPEEIEARTAGHPMWPRERYHRIMHAMQIGTVDELVECFRSQLTQSFNSFACKTKDGWDVIPTFGEASLHKQTEVLERYGFNKDMTCYPFKTYHSFKERELRRNEMRMASIGRAAKQDVFERDVLMRLVGDYASRRYSPSSGGHNNPPTDDPDSVQKLIDALTVLRDDAILDGKALLAQPAAQ